MPYVLLHFRSLEPGKAMDAFLRGSARRKPLVSKGGRLFRNAGEPDRYTALLEWDRMEDAIEYASSARLMKILDQLEDPGQTGDNKMARTSVVEEVAWTSE